MGYRRTQADRPYNPKLRVKREEAKAVRRFFRWDEPACRVARETDQGRYDFVTARTLGQWAEASGRHVLSFVDAEWYWLTHGYPEHVAKVFAWEKGMSCREAMYFLRRVRRFFVTVARDYGVDMREFAGALSGTFPDPAVRAKKDAEALLEAICAVRSPQLARDVLLEVWRQGPEVFLGEAQADGTGEAV